MVSFFEKIGVFLNFNSNVNHSRVESGHAPSDKVLSGRVESAKASAIADLRQTKAEEKKFHVVLIENMTSALTRLKEIVLSVASRILLVLSESFSALRKVIQGYQSKNPQVQAEVPVPKPAPTLAPVAVAVVLISPPAIQVQEKEQAAVAIATASKPAVQVSSAQFEADRKENMVAGKVVQAQPTESDFDFEIRVLEQMPGNIEKAIDIVVNEANAARTLQILKKGIFESFYENGTVAHLKVLLLKLHKTNKRDAIRFIVKKIILQWIKHLPYPGVDEIIGSPYDVAKKKANDLDPRISQLLAEEKADEVIRIIQHFTHEYNVSFCEAQRRLKSPLKAPLQQPQIAPQQQPEAIKPNQMLHLAVKLKLSGSSN